MQSAMRLRGDAREMISSAEDLCRGAMAMMTMSEMAADQLGKLLAEDVRRLFGSAQQEHAERLDGIARIALECLGRSDALYHNLEHTFLVTLVGRDILRGRMLTERLEPDDYAHLTVACLLHRCKAGDPS
jgi:hypothetical protein